MTSRPGDDAAIKATGRDWAAWFSDLDGWAAELDHKSIAAALRDQGVSGWWAQTIANAWEQARGRREKHEMPDGFQATASKTIASPPEAVWKEVSTGAFREWAPTGWIEVTTAHPNKTLRGAWNSGGRVAIYLTEKPGGKTQIAVNHEKISDAGTCDIMKAAWRAALANLKERLE